MSFQVYYRKWRPQRFSELVAQEHVSTTLRQAVQQGRVAHSYLLSGPRGTGKTSTARILAKALNCLQPQDGDPCSACAHCEAIAEGRYMDLIELDAASNRGIDEIRNLRDKVNLAPAEGLYKVYIIDEAHMLTEFASNAFLKTLEEPPSHAVFVLCTTEHHKILPTIISRCQRFDFRRLTSESIVERLRTICEEEGVDAETDVLTHLARSAAGSLRDAENLLEQLVVSYGNHLGMAELHELLGVAQDQRALDFTGYLLTGNASAALECINRASWDGADLRQIHRQAVDYARGVLMIHCAARDSLDMPRETVAELEQLASKTSLPRVMRSLKLLGEVNMKLDSSSPLPLELAAVEACMEETPEPLPPRPSAVPAPTPSSRVSTPAKDPGTPAASSPPPRAAAGRADGAGVPAAGRTTAGRAPSSERSAGQNTPSEDAAPSPEGTKGTLEENWGQLIKVLSRYKGKRFNIGALLRDCKSQHVEGETLVLAFAHRSNLERMQEELDDPQSMKTVNEAFGKSLGTTYRLRLTLAQDNGGDGIPMSTQSPLVRAAQSMGARILEERDQ